jgi:peptide/nickel transport system substrate-binding protein
MTVVLGLWATALAGPGDNSLIIATSQEPVVIGGDPNTVLTSAAIRSEIELYLNVGLYRTDIDGELQPVLATEVATADNGRLRFEDIGDGEQRLEYDITLRDDVFWSDGQPITSADAELWVEMGTTPGMPVAGPDFYARVSIEVQDERNFTVTMEPAQSSDLFAAVGIAPAHVMRAGFEEVRTSAEALDPEADAERVAEIYRGFFTQFASPEAVNQGRMVYSGPFVPVRWASGSSFTMARNPEFFMHPDNQDEYVQTVEYQFISDTNALLIAVLGGGVDATSSVALTFDQGLSPTLQNRAAGRFDIWFIPSPVWEHMDVNQWTDTVQQVADLQLDDVRTRQALVHAMDRQGMTDALYEGLQPVAHTDVHPVHPFFNPDVVQYDYNPERAAELFAELGWERGGDGILQRTTEDGRNVRFELEFVTTAGNAARERQQQFIAEDWQQAGVAVQINNAPATVVFANEFSGRAYEGSWSGVFMFAWVSSLASTANQATYLCENRPRPENNFAGQNYGGYCSPEYDEVRNRAVREFDLEAATPIYQELQDMYAQDLPALPLIFRSNAMVTRTGLVNFVTNTYANGFGYPPVEPWLVGWDNRDVEQVYDQTDYALALEQE